MGEEILNYPTLKLIDKDTGQSVFISDSIKDISIDNKYIETKSICWNHKTELNFNIEALDKETIDKLNQVDRNQPFNLEVSSKYEIIVQAKKHKQKRINKKWLKKYGYKTVLKTRKFQITEVYIK